MIISDTAINKRVSVVVLALLILLAGLYSYFALPRESAPDITIPYVFITASYRGVSPPDMETSVTIPIEKKLTGLENVKKIKSVSAEGLSSIVIEFLSGTDIDTVLQKVKDKVDEAQPDLPADLEEDPRVFEVNFSELPIVVFSLSGTVGSGRLREIADDLADTLETIPGVLEVEIRGGREREIRVEFLPEKLSYFNLSLPELEATLRQENQNVSGGAIHLGDGRLRLQTPGEMKTPEEFMRLVVGSHAGQPVYLADVARVFDGFKDETSRSRLDGRTAVTLMVKKRAGENIIRITDRLDDVLEREQATWPQGTRITKLMDQAKDIRNMVADLENNLISGLLLVLLVLPVALGLRNAVLVSLAIPFSMFLSFVVLHALGITLNMVVLFSLTLALGMLVDNAIVIVENIYRFTAQGVPRLEAAKRATSEVAYPVIGSTLTTLAAFFPMLFWPGIMGEFMRYLPLTLIVTLSASLFVALVITPALASYLLKEGGGRAEVAGSGGLSAAEIQAAGERPLLPTGRILTAYRRFLEIALNNRLAVLGISFGLLVLVLQIWLLRVGLERPVEFFPAVDPANLYVNLELPEGADVPLADRLVRQVEMAVSDRDMAAAAYADVGRYQEALASKTHRLATGETFTGVSDLDNIRYVFAAAASSAEADTEVFGGMALNHVGVQFLDFKDRLFPSTRTVKQIRERLHLITGAKITIQEEEAGPPTGPPINIEIAGNDFNVLGRLAQQIREVVARVPFVEDVRDDFVQGAPTIKIRVDRQKAALVGLSAPLIGQALKKAYNGVEVSTYHEQDEEYDLTVQLPHALRSGLDTLTTLLIPAPGGRLVPLTTVARFEYTGSLGRIVRINNERVVTVQANVDEERIPAAVVRSQVQGLLQPVELPPGYRLRFTGEQEEQQESEAFLAKAFLAALFLVALVLVTQFNSLSQPFIIMTSVILSLAGAFLGLILFKMSFGIIMTGVGVISLAGVVVNNGIVLIDYTNRLRGRGLSPPEAIIAAGCTRLRPVLLTAITTILGLIPMVTGVSFDFHALAMTWSSQSSQWWRSMATAVIFGLLVATLLTLVVVPTLYSLFETTGRQLTETRQRLQRGYRRLHDKIFN